MYRNLEDRKAYDRKWNQDNRDRKRAINAVAEVKLKAWYRSLKTKCSLCPEDDPDCLTWHHLDPTTKTWTPGLMVKSLGRERILEELAKCQLLCANCHLKEEARKRR